MHNSFYRWASRNATQAMYRNVFINFYEFFFVIINDSSHPQTVSIN